MDENNNLKYFGAQFYKCALQVNPWEYVVRYGQSVAGVESEEDYNQKILEECNACGIKVVGLADHNNAQSSEKLREKLRGGGIVVFPGFEIESSEGIHMVCLYGEDSKIEDLQHYIWALLDINDEPKLNPPTQSERSINGIARMIKSQKGFWFAAHMTGQNGILRLKGAGDNHKDFWKKDDLLVAGQIPGKLEDIPDAEKEIIENKNPDYKRGKKIVVINAKDVKTPGDLREDSASVQIKMTKPCMEAFKDAFYDPDSRVMLNHNAKEPRHGRILSIVCEGASIFPYGAAVKFSDNLNTVIGGRGTGKSTLLEGIRYALDMLPGTEKARDKHQSLCEDIYGNAKITLTVYSAKYGGEYTVSRGYGGLPKVTDKEGHVKELNPCDILPEVEIYSHDEIHDVAGDKSKQLKLLDRFLPDPSGRNETMKQIKRKLSENREQLVGAMKQKERLEELMAGLPELKEKLRVYERFGIEEKMEEIRLIKQEKTVMEKIESQISDMKKWLESYSDSVDLDFVGDSVVEKFPNKEILSRLAAQIRALDSACGEKIKKMEHAIDSFREAVEKANPELNAKHESADEKFRRALEKLSGSDGRDGADIPANIQKTIQRVSFAESQKPILQKIEERIVRLKKERRNIVAEYEKTASRRAEEMDIAINKINEGELENKVLITLERMAVKDRLKEFFRKIDGVGAHAIKWIDEHNDAVPIKLAEVIAQEKDGGLMRKYGVAAGVARKMAAACENDREMLLKLEEVEVKDAIGIQLNTAHEDAREAVYRPLDKLSAGQKCTAILNIILLESQDPLIIDQPEDNLDNSFIAERIVKDLRIWKDKRQFIFATHNANIPVFGDAELILVLEPNLGKISGDNIGSIDKTSVRAAAARILDGGREAFYMRQHKYGFDDHE